ncbi:MAG: hypothetical protein JW953_11665 [Anaerolineae bacterium]|nr:hypothetical protein [Anaerolineae bacterium]
MILARYFLNKTMLSGLIGLALLCSPLPAFAQAEARVYPQVVSATNETIIVEVMVENVTDLYGVEFRLKYDPAALAVQDLETEQGGVQIEGGSLLSADQIFVVANQVDEAGGIITFAVSLLNPAPPIAQDGPLARVTFKVLQQRPSTLDVEHAKLVAFDLHTIPCQTAGLALGNKFNGSGDGDNVGLDVGGEITSGVGGDETPPLWGEPLASKPKIVVHGGGFSWRQVMVVAVTASGVSILGSIFVMGSGGLLVFSLVKRYKWHRYRRIPARFASRHVILN